MSDKVKYLSTAALSKEMGFTSSAVQEVFRRDNVVAARDIIEGEPRLILESWNEVNSGVLHEVRKDYKAEKYVK